MAIKRVWIEEDCIACGTCEGICPELISMISRRVLKRLPKAARSRLSNTNRRKHINPYFSFLDKITESLRDL